ncbi:Helix-turn-helix [Microbulbifer donghaiensis]|uniref:Helix-turn-helix n=1 Tax=Microbulbifer donghaiensis TaxID=494016 RepID=A0A1M5IKW4_9GAMM|nr:Helix-turn-helix [Microbulbifer donghaiensis]
MKLISQIKQRRLALGLQQKDMKLRIGMKQQQYQRIEAGGNPRLDTLELVAEGLDAELVLVPKEKLRAVRELLRAGSPDSKAGKKGAKADEDPWSDILE